ncbi:MAG: hypothetical protein Q8P92_04965 [Candidatus Daviesbacteria bacterium]|nr:hypothetical protein [Candidatus Daviesbacteria bacterium]
MLQEILSERPFADEALSRSFRALVLAETLIYQTNLPIEKRYVFNLGANRLARGKKRLYAEVARTESYALAEDDTAYLGAKNTTEEFKGWLGNVLTKTPQTDEEAEIIIKMDYSLQNLLRQEREYSSYWAEVVSPQSRAWHDKLTWATDDNIWKDPRFSRLLLEGKFGAAISRTREMNIWSFGWGFAAHLDNETKANYPHTSKDFVKYFLDHPRLQMDFWKTVVTEKENLFRYFYFNPDAYPDAADGYAEFLETIPFSGYSHNQQDRFIRRMLVAAGFFLAKYPQNPATEVITGKLQELISQSASPQSFVDEQAVLKDVKPGVLYMNSNAEARARLIPLGKIKDEFLAEQKKQGVKIIYTSKVEQIEQKTEGLGKQPEESRITADTTLQSKTWGEIGVVGEDLEMLLKVLNKKLAESGINQDVALDVLAGYATNTKGSRAIVVIPDLLPSSNTLSKLGSLGLVAIQQEGDSVSCIFDSKTIGGDSNVEKIALIGTINGHNDLVINNAGEEFDTSVFYLLLNAAALFGRMQFTDYKLEKDEISEVRSFIKSYNREAKGRKRPQVRFDENPEIRDLNLPLTITYIRKKPVLLSIMMNHN